MSKALTAAQRKRLDKLATYLEGLPEDYEHFGMLRYLSQHSDRDYAQRTVHYARHNGGVASCGTAACAVGHGPAAGILMPPRLLKEFTGLGGYTDMCVWNRYSALFIGTGNYEGYANGLLFEWLFGAEWASNDNHHYGAAARIRYLLEHGAPPAGFRSASLDDDWTRIYAPYRIGAKATAA